MFKKLIWVFSSLVFFLVPAVAFAQEAAPDDLGGLISSVVDAAKGGEWSVFASLVIMLLVYLVTKVSFVKSWLPNSAKPWVSAIAGVLAAVATTALTTGSWLTAVLNGLVTGAAASGFWSLIGKKLLPQDKEETTEG